MQPPLRSVGELLAKLEDVTVVDHELRRRIVETAASSAAARWERNSRVRRGAVHQEVKRREVLARAAPAVLVTEAVQSAHLACALVSVFAAFLDAALRGAGRRSISPASLPTSRFTLWIRA
jgi:hypothetical protein